MSANLLTGASTPNPNSVITIHRRVQLCLITSGAISTLAPVAFIAFGNGGTDTVGEPIPPSDEADSLTNEIGRYPIGDVVYPLDPGPRITARYSSTIPENDLNGAVINEAALVDADGHICAIKTMYDKRKDAGVTFTFTFDDEF